MIRRVLGWFGIGVRREGHACANCRYFADHRDLEEDPDEVDGYCTYDFVNKVPNVYGGHWTHSKSWCSRWTEGPSIWKPEATE